ncbi:thioredoxin family protein [Photobacterium alginatilyticum]|uniref:Thioredoxin family protein n=1 Tax=Photobacterium alginatilyticum TaxID=1775171 RepID=A0ABW9YNH3_9GAMM|nr:thioredoxin family protein [Photobacterium alginatilyticum]NBI55424.1 thioredoxin family protein [Photobacterium alginatilyticum]
MLLDTPKVQIGWKAPEFTLADPDGNSFTMSEHLGEQGLLIAFICNHCPYVQAIADRLAKDARELQAEGINVLAVMSNDYSYVEIDSPPYMKQFAKQHDFSFPYLVDKDQAVGKAYGAVCTPDFFGFNKNGELQYRGRLDDARMAPPQNRSRELIDAMRLIANTGKGPEKQHPSMGCSIKWK